jgi:hypothetical protein
MVSIRMSRWRSSRIRTSLPATNKSTWVLLQGQGDNFTEVYKEGGVLSDDRKDHVRIRLMEANRRHEGKP